MSPRSKKFAFLIMAGGAVALLAIFFLGRQTAAPNAAHPPDAPAAAVSAPGARVSEIAARAGTAVTTDPKFAESSRKKVAELEQILDSRNDNDPRLDSDFRALSSDDKQALRARYSQYPKEKRNELGTIVFLLGREISDPSDLDFFESIVKEKPCLSLADCTQDSKPVAGEDSHREAGVEVTLNYPQMVVLNSLEKLFESGAPPPASVRDAALRVLNEASRSGIPMVERKAREILATAGGQ